MKDKKFIDINLQTGIILEGELDKKWLDEFVRELELEAEECFDMGFSSSWNVQVEEVEELK